MALHTIEYCFLAVDPDKIIFLIYNIIPQKRIESYSMLGTIVCPNEILLNGAGRSRSLACLPTARGTVAPTRGQVPGRVLFGTSTGPF